MGPESTHIDEHTGDGAALLASQKIGKGYLEGVGRLDHVPDFIPDIFNAQLIVSSLDPFLVYIPEAE